MYLIEESENFASNLLSSSFFVIHNSLTCSHNEIPELTRRQQATHPVLNVTGSNIVTGGDNAALVQSSIELYDDLTGAVVVNKLKFANVSVFHHDLQELDDHFGRWANQDLLFAAFFSIIHAFLQCKEV